MTMIKTRDGGVHEIQYCFNSHLAVSRGRNMYSTVCSILVIPQLFLIAQHVSSGYLDIPSWDGIANSTYGPSLVSAPVLDYVNDTAATLVWTLNTSGSVSRIASTFTVEVAFDLYCEDFVTYDRIDVVVPPLFSNNSFTASYTVANLLSKSSYRFRICPIFQHVQGHCSLPLSVTTLDSSNNYWEPIMSRRLSLAASGRGFAAPVMDRPHLDPGVEIFAKGGVSEDLLRFADPVTAESPVLPSGRRGHSLSQIDQTVFMFGGRTNGYSCSNVYKDILNLGNAESGRDVYPCVHFQSEVHELWSFDVNNYQWVFLNTSKWQSSRPAAREQHSAVVIDRNLYIFGGKSRTFEKNSDGELVMTPHSDEVFGDLWRLDVERQQLFVLKYASDNPPIPQNGRLFAVIDGKADISVSKSSSSISPRHSLCVDELIVKVTVHHPCIKQLKVSLFGPGPRTGSPNFFAPSSDQEVLLIDRLTSNGTGCISGDHEFQFDDRSQRLPESCCPTSYSGVYRPQGLLSEYIGSTMAADWTLVLQDLVDDNVQGYLKSFSLEFTTSPCFKKFIWTNLTAPSTASRGDRSIIPARSAARAVAYEQSMFIYGGRDRFDNPLSDLWRFDVATISWMMLTPVQFDNVLNPASSVGANYLLTTWGLVRIGGYYRQPNLPERYDNYDDSVSIQDPVTLRWTQLRLLKRSPLDYDSTFGRSDSPSPRYLGAAVFLSSHTLHWHNAYTDRVLYNQQMPSQRTNFQGTVTDSILFFGGFDGSTGSVFDGSSGGYFSDSWMLRLANYSTAGSRFHQQDYVNKHCRWRKNSSALSKSGTRSCLSTTEGTSCEWRDLLMLAWCSANNQTIS